MFSPLMMENRAPWAQRCLRAREGRGVCLAALLQVLSRTWRRGLTKPERKRLCAQQLFRLALITQGLTSVLGKSQLVDE